MVKYKTKVADVVKGQIIADVSAGMTHKAASIKYGIPSSTIGDICKMFKT